MRSIAGALLVLSLAACGESPTATDSKTTPDARRDGAADVGRDGIADVPRLDAGGDADARPRDAGEDGLGDGLGEGHGADASDGGADASDGGADGHDRRSGEVSSAAQMSSGGAFVLRSQIGLAVTPRRTSGGAFALEQQSSIIPW